jgi:hypothetical protein
VGRVLYVLRDLGQPLQEARGARWRDGDAYQKNLDSQGEVMDDRPVYSDTGYFTRGRTGYRAEPIVKERRDAAWALIALGVLALVFVAVHFVLPSVR